MVRIILIISSLLLGLLLASCSASRWVIKEDQAIDTSDYQIIDQHKFLAPADSLTPDNPVLELNLKSHTVRRFNQKTLAQRSIQDYRLRPGFLLLGLAGGAAAFYAGNSERFSGGTGQMVGLNAFGVLLAASGFINLKPVGPPQSVQEERYRGTTGTVIKTDTLSLTDDEPLPAAISVIYRGKTVFEDNPDTLINGRLNIPLAQNLSDLSLSGRTPGDFEISVEFNDSTYRYQYSISDVLQPYAQTTVEFTSLRREPVYNPENVLADLTKGSLLKIDQFRNDDWYEVRYGNFKNYIADDQAEVIWQPADFSTENSVVALPRIPFGNIDVEANIPTLREQTPKARALIITNENYAPDLGVRRYTHRDGELMISYLDKALGYPPKSIHHLMDINSEEEVEQVIKKLKATSDEETELFIFISGYGSINEDTPELIGVAEEEGENGDNISLRSVFSKLTAVPANKVFLIGDIDFSSSIPSNVSADEGQNLIEEIAALLTQNSDAAVVTGSRVGQASHLYNSDSSDNKLHHIFPYFFARALQQKRTNLTRIAELLNRNINYTSRKLHNQGQNPVIYGNRSLSFIRE